MIRNFIYIISLFAISLHSFSQDQTLQVKVIIDQDDTQAKIDVFRCYLSNFQIQYSDGTRHQIDNSYHLIDLEESESLMFKLSGLPEGKIESVSFLIGTDSLVNVSGAFDGDLDPIYGMYWTWNSGYINIKLEGTKTNGSVIREFEFHIGGYSGEQATARKVSIDYVKNNEMSINIDLGKFLSVIDLDKTAMVMSPGKKAVMLADEFAKCVHE